MKSGKRPTRRQMEFMAANGLNPADWLIVKNQDHQMVVVKRGSRQVKTLEI